MGKGGGGSGQPGEEHREAAGTWDFVLSVDEKSPKSFKQRCNVTSFQFLNVLSGYRMEAR